MEKILDKSRLEMDLHHSMTSINPSIFSLMRKSLIIIHSVIGIENRDRLLLKSVIRKIYEKERD